LSSGSVLRGRTRGSYEPAAVVADRLVLGAFGRAVDLRHRRRSFSAGGELERFRGTVAHCRGGTATESVLQDRQPDRVCGRLS
jgi:hypothetical protein